MKKRGLCLFTLVAVVGTLATNAIAGQLGYFDSSWNTIVAEDGIIGPGGGGQQFDAEYLFYKQEGSKLYIGLQTGFNVILGYQDYSNKRYWAGDLALSFDTTHDSYEYAIDFGLETKNYNGTNAQQHLAGLYKVSTWDEGIYYTNSLPFAMTTGDKKADLASNLYGSESDSYYRVVSFDLSDPDLLLDLSKQLTIGVHWTMSCGNDEIEGIFRTAPVPEPATMLLFGTGLIGLAGIARRRRND